MSNLKPKTLFVATVAALVLGMSAAAPAKRQKKSKRPQGRLIVFVQPGASSIDDQFIAKHLPEVEKLAKSDRLDLVVHDIRAGAPKTVAITPLVVFQNHLGASTYQGRFTSMDRMKNFIRTSRHLAQPTALDSRQNLPVWRHGRSQIWAPIKITNLTGRLPIPFDQRQFKAEAEQALFEGFQRFRKTQSAQLGRSDRGFYLDIYPYLSGAGQLTLTVAVFSQFHCKKPVFKYKGAELSGPWNHRATLFKAAGSVLETAVAKVIADPTSGDSFQPVAAAVPVKSLQALGYTPPPPPKVAKSKLVLNTALPRQWVLSEPSDDTPPLIQFRFPPPLDNYAGEVTRAKGQIAFKDSLLPAEATGSLTVDTSSVTMGLADLNAAIQGESILNVIGFKSARFEVRSVAAERSPIAWGKLSTAQVRGVFAFKSVEVPIQLPMDLEATVGRDQTPNLIIRGGFELDLRPFGIKGPDGPDPQNHTLDMDLYLVFEPAP